MTNHGSLRNFAELSVDASTHGSIGICPSTAAIETRHCGLCLNCCPFLGLYWLAIHEVMLLLSCWRGASTAKSHLLPTFIKLRSAPDIRHSGNHRGSWGSQVLPVHGYYLYGMDLGHAVQDGTDNFLIVVNSKVLMNLRICSKKIYSIMAWQWNK